MTVADHQPPALLVELACERIDVGGDLGLQRRRQHLPGAVADDLIKQRDPPAASLDTAAS